jgi:DNA ligase (NAD+)
MGSAAQIRKKMKALREKIAEANDLYYKKNQPRMPDKDYDLLKKELESLEQWNPDIAAELDKEEASPTAKVGSDLTGELPTVKHIKPMLSLDNSYNKEEVEEFDLRLKRALKMEEGAALGYVVEPKIDGLSISAVYENGKLVRAVTRGDGEEGEVVTQNFLTIPGVPREWPGDAGAAPKIVELRGEVYLAYEQFQKINAERESAGLELYANPRNLAAGTLKLKTIPDGEENAREFEKLKENLEEVKRRGLRAIFYGLGEFSPTNSFTSHSAFLDFLKKNNFPTQERWWNCKGIAEAWKAIEELDALRKNFKYPTDGAVIKLDDYGLRELAGFTARSPRWAFAYKYMPERAEAVLRKITVQVGRTGVLTPVAELESTDPERKGRGVELSGSEVARATLHNADEIARKDVREGDTVIIEKAGEVIPAVINVVVGKRPKDSKPFEFPKVCPACGEKVIKIEGEVAVRCVNPECPAQRKRALEHFASRNAMAIDELGEVVVGELVDAGLVKTPADLYRLTKETLGKVDYFQNKKAGIVTGKLNEKSAENLLNAIAQSKGNDLWRLIHGLGIPQVGETVSQLLAGEFGSLDALQTASQERLIEISGIGESMAESVVKFFANPERQKMIGELKNCGVNMLSRAQKKQTDGPLAGKKFVLTGELKNYTRSQAKEKIESLGGKVIGKVSKSIEAVIVGEEPGSKLSEARKLGVKILEEGEFEKLILGE